MNKLPIVAVIILALSLTPMSVSSDEGAARVTRVTRIARVFYYGDINSPYLGRRHAASHWGQTPDSWPEVVDLEHYGIATSDWAVPFGTRLCLEVIAFPSWARDEYSDHVGTVVCGTVVDRMSSWVHEELGPSLDLWPRLFQELVGDDWRRVGTFAARYWVQRRKRRIKLRR